MARAVAGVLHFDGLVGVERLLGAVWLAGALCLGYAAARRLGADTWVTVALLVMVASTEQVLYTHATVSNDATALFTGALCLYAVVRDRGTRRAALLLLGAGLIAGASKITNGFGVGAACLFAFFAPWVRNAAGDVWSRLRPGVLLAGGYLASTVAWQIAMAKTQIVAPRDLSIFNRFEPPKVDVGVVLSQISAFANPFNPVAYPHTEHAAPAYVPELFGGPFPMLFSLVVAFVLIAGSYGSWALLRGRDGEDGERLTVPALGGSVCALLLLGGPLQFLLVYLSTTAGYTEGRYAFSMLPAMVAVTALIASRRARIPLGAIAACAFATMTVVALWSHTT